MAPRRERIYTVHDTPHVVERIEHDLHHLETTVREADPALRSLVLTGGFARGEGAVVDGQPQNDYDLVALRGLRPPDRGYDALAHELEEALGLHIDLAPVPTWRLGFVEPSIFWYETARRGRVLWGEDLLDEIPIQHADQIDPDEGLRLLTNRAAGLLLATRDPDPHAYRLQATKALLAALDAHLLAHGTFPPSQTERWDVYRDARDGHVASRTLDAADRWLTWAYRFKVLPGRGGQPDPEQAWCAAAQTLLASVPTALDHAGYDTLDDYAATDGLVDHLHYVLHAGRLPEAKRWAINPTGTVRAATLRLLSDSSDGTVDPDDVREHLAPIADVDGHPLDTLEALRRVTLQ